LTPQKADGRSNRRRFTDEQKRAMVQETEQPGIAVAEIWRRHGIAISTAAASLAWFRQKGPPCWNPML
jgi:transposase-like protein